MGAQGSTRPLDLKLIQTVPPLALFLSSHKAQPRKVDILVGWNLCDRDTREELASQVDIRKPKCMMLSPPCTVLVKGWLDTPSVGEEEQIL